MGQEAAFSGSFGMRCVIDGTTDISSSDGREERVGNEQVYNTLTDTGGRPSCPIRPMPNVCDAEHTDGQVHALCRWEAPEGVSIKVEEESETKDESIADEDSMFPLANPSPTYPISAKITTLQN